MAPPQFWSQVIGRAYGESHVLEVATSRSQFLRQPKPCQLDGPCLCQKNMFWLEATMHDALRMEHREGLAHRDHDAHDRAFFQAFWPSKMLHLTQCLAWQILQDQVTPLPLLLRVQSRWKV